METDDKKMNGVKAMQKYRDDNKHTIDHYFKHGWYFRKPLIESQRSHGGRKKLIQKSGRMNNKTSESLP